MMFFCVSGQDQSQGSVAGDVAGSSEAVLQCENGKHQSSTGIIEEQNAGDQSQGSHNRSARYTGSANGKDTKEQAEKYHGSKRRNGSIEDLRYGHNEEYFGQNGSAQMDICKQGNTEVYHVFTKYG